MTDLPVALDGNLFRVAFDLAPSGMLALSEGGSILLANREAERVFGYEPGTLLGVSVDELVPAALRAKYTRYREDFFAAPEARAMGTNRDLSAQRRNGSEFPIELGLTPVRTDQGPVVIVTILDITERKQAERDAMLAGEHARRAQKLEAVGTLAGGIAHDFNNLLLGIVGFTELAQRQIRETPSAVEDLDQVLRAAERGRLLVRRILAFARQHDNGPAPIQLERVVHEAGALLRASLPATIEISVSVEPGLPPVVADETLVHQIILNLGTNASHAMEQGGMLRVTLLRAEADAALLAANPSLAARRLLRLSVIDNGSGMTPDVRARLFEPYFTTKPLGKGSGHGLPVIGGIVQSLGGAIEIQSKSGKGTRVDVWIPVADEVPGERLAGDAALDPEDRPLHVLFVEDEPVLAAMEQRQLEALDFTVTVHTSSVEALADFRARPHEFDLLMTDNTMPQMTGLVLAKHIKVQRPDLPVLMVSGYADFADPSVLENHGVSAVLRKPHTLMELEKALSSLLER